MDRRSHSDPLNFWIVLIPLFLVSCAAQKELRQAAGEPPFENLVEVQQASRVPVSPVQKGLGSSRREKGTVLQDLTLPQSELVPKKPRDKGPRFSLSAEEVDVKSILFGLSKEIDQNIVIDPGISKKVTLNLNDVTLKEMLDHVLLPLDLRYDAGYRPFSHLGGKGPGNYPGPARPHFRDGGSLFCDRRSRGGWQGAAGSQYGSGK